MYCPAHFDESNPAVLQEFMRRHPLASVIALAAGRLDANHVPLALDPGHGPFGRLRGHIARANPMWREVENGAEVLVLFHGPNSYISPSFYPSKKEHGKVVPTWNYGVVHARGNIAWMHDLQQLRQLVDNLTERHERERAHPWQVSDAPDEYIRKMLTGIAGFEISIVELRGKMKLSQNRSEADRAGVSSGLSQSADPSAVAMAVLMGGNSSGSAS
jgi:transcriptional regulator